MRTILFDFDGTVADTLPLIFTAFRSTFQHFLQKHYTNEQIIALFGPTETGIVQNELPPHEHTAALDHFFAAYTDEHERMQNPPEIARMLEQLQTTGIQMGIVTGKGRRSADISLREWQLTSFFDVVITGDDVTNPKPHPEGIRLAMEQLGVNASETIYVGDSDADILAGRAAGLTTVGVDWLAVTQKAGKFDPQPDYLFTDVQSFVDWVMTLRSFV
ncbi:haloacid dehalogenase [Brevibacillus choshinensis]|uniref:Haloacid dehalogenase n=1 Tax=Brevibacillus choshinensis TaxID=54911 RepID=A0ABR5N2V7_BRECH|nr:HAD family hydrolase [Brevibacillus choshinensis]KQL44837.1 haloacid dehalogenase [Brevibacillus choshinensis]